MSGKAFHFLAAKKTTAAVKLLKWSPKFDLVVMVSREGVVSLYRSSSFQRIWETPVDVEGSGPAVSVAWRPDGRVVAIGYNKGRIRIFSLEGASVNGNPQGPACLHDIKLTSSVCTLEWFTERHDERAEAGYKPHYVCFSASLAPEVPNVAVHWLGEKQMECSPREVGLDSNAALLPSSCLDILVAGYDNGCVELFLCGLLPIGCLHTPGDGRPIDLCLSADWTRLSVTSIEHIDSAPLATASRTLYDVSAILGSRDEAASLCQLYGKLQALANYISWATQVIIDSWEDVMEQINEKLCAMVKEVTSVMGPVSIRSVLLRLLSRGTLPWFAFVSLQQELSEGTLLRVSSRLTSCHDTMRQTIVNSLLPALQHMLVTCQDGVGMVTHGDKFSCFGVSAGMFEACAQAVAALSLKCQELMSVMATSSEDLACFLRWLQCLAVKGMLSKLTTKDSKIMSSIHRSELRNVGKFISRTFSDVCGSFGEEKQFDMEHVGQYLCNEPLAFPHTPSGTTLDGVLKDLGQFAGDRWLYIRNSSTSLVQDCWTMDHAVRNTLAPASVAFAHLLKYESCIKFAVPSPAAGCSSSCLISSALLPGSDSGLCHVAVAGDSLVIIVSECDLHRAAGVHFEDKDASSRLPITDAHWYTEKRFLRPHQQLTVLLAGACLAQVDLNPMALEDIDYLVVDANSHLVLSPDQPQCFPESVLLPGTKADTSLSRGLESRRVTGVAVGGDRQLACVVAGNGHHLSFFDLAQTEEDEEVEDDEEEDGCPGDGES